MVTLLSSSGTIRASKNTLQFDFYKKINYNISVKKKKKTILKGKGKNYGKDH